MILELADNSIDFAYIDANHSWESVSSEISVIYKKMKNGSVLMFNDYVRFNINQVLPYGVQSAVNQFANETESKILGVALAASGNYDIAVSVNRGK